MRLTQQKGYAVRRVCAVLGLSSSSYYHEPMPSHDQRLCTAIEEIVSQFPTYGTRRVSAQLQRPPYDRIVNRKRVQRVMGQMGFKQSLKRRKCRTTQSGHAHPRYPNLVEGLEVTHPDQVWVSDISYIRLRREFVYLSAIMDVFTRVIRGWNMSRSLDQTLTLVALRQALSEQTPQIHHSDQGVHYAATAYVQTLQTAKVQISMAKVGQAWQNGCAERLIRTIKEEEVDLSEYEDFADARSQTGYFIEEVYQRKRIHSALGYLTPAEFEAAWMQDQSQATLLRSQEKVSNSMGPLHMRSFS